MKKQNQTQRRGRAMFVVDMERQMIFGQFFQRSSAVEIRNLCRKTSDLFLEVGTNVRIIGQRHPDFQYYAANFKRGTEKDVTQIQRAASRVERGSRSWAQL